MTILATLCYILNEDKILLQKKSKELFGGDKYNAPGGKLKPEESPLIGVIREVLEETGLVVRNLQPMGKVYFYEPDWRTPSWEVYLFLTKDFQGELKQDYREGSLEWIAKKDIPYEQMWEDNKYFVPFILEGDYVEGRFYFKPDFKELIGFDVRKFTG